MSKGIDGTFTIREVLAFTKQEYKNRFDYRDRDVLRKVSIRKITELTPDQLSAPTIRYEVTTSSYPQYKPYLTGTDSRGRSIGYQRTTKHFYDLTFTCDKLSIDTRNWKMACGSMGVWNSHPPQNQIKNIYKSTMTKWLRERDAKLLRARTPADKKKIKDDFVKKIKQHKANARYLDIGDWNAQTKKINADFIFRVAYVYYIHNHLFGRNYFGYIPPNVTNPKQQIFFTKHALRFIEFCLKRGIFKTQETDPKIEPQNT